MSKSHALEFLVERSEERVEKAAVELGQANVQLNQLHEQKQQIIDTLNEPMKPIVMSAAQMINLMAWRSRLYQLEASCEKAIEQASEEVQHRKADLQGAQTEKMKFEAVLKRAVKRRELAAARKEQKVSDEFAANSWRRHAA